MIDFTHIDSRLDKILEPTYGQLIFQEQVTEIAQQLAGWTAGQADALRKAIGRKIPAEMAELIPKLHKAFVEYGGITDIQADTLCTGIENCASYSFNKCLAGDELIGFADYKEAVSVRELYEDKLLQLRYLNSMIVIENRDEPLSSMYLRSLGKNKIKTVEKISDCAPVLKITLENGANIKVTPQHKFPIVDRFKKEEVTAYEIFCKYKYEPMYLTVRRQNTIRAFKTMRVCRCEFAGYSDIYNIEMDGNPHNYIMKNGIVSSNSHSVEYGLIAYQTAYLKANYPLEYMCSLLNANYDSEEDIVKYKEECERMGIEILPPSVKAGNLRYEPEGNAIRMGLNSIKGVNNVQLDYFTNFDDWISKNGNLNKRIKEALIKSGACDCFGLPRKTMLCKALGVYDEIQKYETKITEAKDKITAKTAELATKKDGTKIKAQLIGQIKRLNEAIDRYENERDALQLLADEPFDEIVGEKEVLGFTFQDEFSKYDTSKYPLYNAKYFGSQTFYANVIGVKKIKDKNGKPMAFISAIPYKSKAKVEFVMFSSRYEPMEVGLYLLRVEKKTQLTGCYKLP